MTVVNNIPSLFVHAAKQHAKHDAFQHKRDGRYVDISHNEVLDSVQRASDGLNSLRLAKGDRVALLSENRLEWVIADLAILSNGCINVPIYPTLPAGQIEYILRDSEARAIFVSSEQQMEKIRAIRANLPHLDTVICFDGAGTDGVVGFDQLLEKTGAAAEPFSERIATIGKYDWASIIYTSGTTGDPKGVILNHWNFITSVVSCSSAINVGPTDRYLSFLPLSHIFERAAGYYTMVHNGVTISYAESIDTVAENLLEVSPTVVLSVPRLYEKMYARILDMVASGSALKKGMFGWAIGAGSRFVKESLEKRLKPGTKMQYALARSLVFKKIKAKTGGKLRFFVSGGAPLARNIAEFFFAAGLPVFEGYGLTETSAIVSVNTFEDTKFGTVGKPVEGVDVSIAEDGEIIVKGPNIMLGYYKKPDETSEVLDGEWFHTGDIGHIDDDGFLIITDRKKDIIVTAGGKNVAPQPIENLLKTSKYIAQAILIGNRRKFISAIIVPDPEALTRFAGAAGIEFDGMADLIRDPKINKKMMDEIERKSEHLATFERIKKFILLEKDFTIEDNELTPTMKVRRSVIEKKLAGEIDKLYQS